MESNSTMKREEGKGQMKGRIRKSENWSDVWEGETGGLGFPEGEPVPNRG